MAWQKSWDTIFADFQVVSEEVTIERLGQQLQKAEEIQEGNTPSHICILLLIALRKTGHSQCISLGSSSGISFADNKISSQS